MPGLDNPRHQLFAQHLAQGKTQEEAYKLAGYKPSRFNASHLADKPSIRDRVHEVTTQIVTKEATATAKRPPLPPKVLWMNLNKLACRL